jgi:hypothetical protein
MGGPTMNLLIAGVLFGGILTLYGHPHATPLVSDRSDLRPSTRRPSPSPNPSAIGR